MAKIQFCTVVWGDWHVDAFLSLAIPSLLAPGNLPAFVREHDSRFHIITSQRDAERIRVSKAFRHLETVLPARIAPLGPEAFQGETLDDHVRNQHQRVQEAVASARAEAALPVLIAPDVCWGDGSFARLATIIHSPQAVIYIKHARVIDETVRPAILANGANHEDGVIRLTHREIAALAVEHLHPLLAIYLPDTEHWSEHAEYSLWPAPGEGFQLRVLASDGFVLDRDSNLRHDMRSSATLAASNVFCPGPDEVSGLSLTPLGKDVDWYFTLRKPSPLQAGDWWRVFDHSHNTMLSSKHFSFFATDRTESVLRETDRRSDRWIRRAKASLRLAQIRQRLRENWQGHRAAILASATSHCPELYRLALDPSPLTIFVPTTAALDALPGWVWESLTDRSRTGELAYFVESHTVRGAVTVARALTWRWLLGARETPAFLTVNGTALNIEYQRLQATVNGAEIQQALTAASGDRIYLVNRFPLATPEQQN
jgi:uncharacterized surface protein with fasciclin (FAS1) repeats